MTLSTLSTRVVYEDSDPSGFNAAFETLRQRPGSLGTLVDVTHPDSLPQDLSPWTVTSVARQDVVAAMRANNAGPEDVIRLFEDPTSCVVVTGQQPAVGGGPLYTLYKVATAIRQAEVLSKSHGCPVIPIFWNASDDHDWNEANRLTSWSDGKWTRHKLAAEPAGAHLFDKSFPSLTELAGTLGVDEAVLAGYKGNSLPEWSANLIREAFPTAPLLILEPRWFRPLAVEFNSWLFDRIDTIDQELLMAGSALELRGFKKTFSANEGSALCVALNGRRQRVKIQSGETWGGRQDIVGTAEDVKQSLRVDFENWSPNVIGRPLWVRSLLPVVAEVVGPAETQYQLQLQGIFKHMGLAAPVLIPRLTATVLRAREQRKWDKLGQPLSSLAASDTISVAADLQAVIDERLAGISQLLDRIRGESLSHYPETEGKIDKAVGRLKRDLERLPGLLVRAEEARRADDIARLEGLRAFTHPGEVAQERVASLGACDDLFGAGWWHKVETVIDPLQRTHAWILLEEEGVA